MRGLILSKVPPQLRTDQLNPVSERIRNVAPTHFRDIVVGSYFHSRGAQSRNKFIIVTAEQGRVRFPGRAKVGIDSQVDLYNPAGEPASAALRQFGRLRDFSHSEDRTIKRSCRIFPANRHGELHVIDFSEWARHHGRIPLHH